MKKFQWGQWSNMQNLSPRSYVCGFCGDKIGTSHGYYSSEHNQNIRMYICTNCGRPTFFDGFEGKQTPGPQLGRDIDKLPEDISSIYNEIRSSIKEGNNTAAVLTARKLIMHLAVDKAGATEGDKFINYVEHLKKSGFIPPKSNSWLEKIRNDSNEKNHELKLSNAQESIAHLKFIELLLSFMYEYSDEEKTSPDTS